MSENFMKFLCKMQFFLWFLENSCKKLTYLFYENVKNENFFYEKTNETIAKNFST